MSGDATISNTGALTIANNAITSAKINDGSISDADISATAAIAGTKVNPAFGTQNISTTGTLSTGASTTLNTVNYTWPNAQAIGTRVLQNDGTGNLTWATPSVGLSSTLNSANIFVGNASNVASGVAMSGDATISNTGALTIANNAITSAKINDGTISDADISATAAIAGTKVNPAFGTQNISTTGTLSTGASTTLNTVNYTWPNAQAIGTRVLQNDGTGNLTWATPSVGLSSTLNSANIFVGNASNVASGVAMSGDATIANTGALTIANNAITSAKINDGTISDADISATAAIAGTKVNPAFGTQNISTTGTLSSGDATITRLTNSGFTQLGSGSPAIKTALITGLTAGNETGFIGISFAGITTADKIVSVSVMVNYDGTGNSWIPPNYVATYGYYFTWSVVGTLIWITNYLDGSFGSGQILSKPVRIFITYME